MFDLKAVLHQQVVRLGRFIKLCKDAEDFLPQVNEAQKNYFSPVSFFFSFTTSPQKKLVVSFSLYFREGGILKALGV